MCECIANTHMYMCKETCVYAYVTHVFFHMLMVQNYKHTNLHACSKSVGGQHVHGICVSSLSCNWCVLYVWLNLMYFMVYVYALDNYILSFNKMQHDDMINNTI